MKVVITGATGLLGKATTQCLVDSGHQVIAMDRVQGEVPPEVDLRIGELEDQDYVNHCISGADAVVHLAAIPAPVHNQEYGVFRNNVLSSFSVFNAAAESKCKIVAYASSLSIYGTAWSPKWTSPQYVPVDESHPIVYSESYALSKEVTELTALTWSRRSNTSFIGFRFPYTNSAEKIIDFARNLKEGDPDLLAQAAKILWAYLDIRDAAAAIDLAIRSDLKGVNTFNFAAPDTIAPHTTKRMLAEYHPTTVLRGDFSKFQSPVSSDDWLAEMGYRARFLLDREAL